MSHTQTNSSFLLIKSLSSLTSFKISLNFRYNAWYCASNLPCFETKACLKFLILYLITIPKMGK